MVGQTSRRSIQGRWCALAGALVFAWAAWSGVHAAEPPLPSDFEQPAAGNAGAQADGGKGILDLDVEQLAKTDVVVRSMDVEVTSVAREKSTVGHSPAAVFVISQEMIRRSGATSIAEALRMAPGLDVARINSSTWAVSSRGFNGLYSNKLLVLIDGRTVYSPLGSGVYWDVQDYVLEDIERIEVIRGPGGTLWGANAVNGVINVITKKAGDTQGAYVSVGGGTQERFNNTVRYGGQIGEDCEYRIYGKYFDRGPFFDPVMSANDGWNQGRFGFRIDWTPDRDKSNSLTVQGDHYVGQDGQNLAHRFPTPPYSEIQQGTARNDGHNVLLRWRHVTDESSDWTLQTYYDYYKRTGLVEDQAKTFDVDFQYRFPLTVRQEITCGAGYRYIDYQTPSENPFTLSSVPPSGDLYVVSQFVQDEIALAPDLLGLTLGCKLEQNNYTGLEYQPTARMLWTPDRRHSMWGAVSRAVRTTNPIDRGLFATREPFGGVLLPRALGNPNFQSETLMAYEMGYRVQTTDQFSWDIATFYDCYDRLRTYQPSSPTLEFVPPPPHLILPLEFVNGSYGNTYGMELATNWSVSERWRLYTQYTLFRMLIYAPPGEIRIANPGDNPCHQVYLRSSWNLAENLDFDLMARYVDALPALNVPSYISMDLRLAYRPRKQLELAVVGQNLLQTYHYEWGQSGEIASTGWEVTQVPRGVYGTLTWRR